MTTTNTQPNHEPRAETTALIICPLPTGEARLDRPMLGLTVGDRLLLSLARAGITRVVFAGEGPRPTSDRATFDTVVNEPSAATPPVDPFLVVPADGVLHPCWLDSANPAPERLSVQWVDPSGWPAIAGDPSGWLSSRGAESTEPEHFAVRVIDKDSRRRGQRALLLSLRKSIDGFISRHLNRRISLQISRLLVRTGWRPNALTIVFTIVGIAAGVLVAVAESWWGYLLAGFLFQLQSILDGCDGEVARLTHRFSRTGQWLDTIGDDVTNYLFCLGLAVGQARALDLPWLYIAGGVTLLIQCITTGIMYRRLIQWGTGDLLAIPDTLTKGQVGGVMGKILAFLGVIRKRDFFVFVVSVVTAAQWPLVGFAMIAVGTYISFVGILINDIRIGKMEREGQSTSPK